MTEFLKSEIKYCELQLESSSGLEPATLIVDLVLLLLQRLQMFSLDDESLLGDDPVVASLVVIALIAGHASHRVDDLLETLQEEEPNFLVECYDVISQ